MPTEIEYFNQIINLLTTLVAAFTGAWIAFRFERHSKDNKIKKNNIATANRTLYTIYDMWNTLTQYYDDVIFEYENKDDAWLNMAAIPAASTGLSKFSYSELDFILQSSSPNTYANLLLEEQRFSSSVKLISMRTDLIINTVFPRMSNAGINPGTESDQQTIENAIGSDTVHKLKQYTSGIITNIKKDIASLIDIHEELHKLMKDIYPKNKFIKVKFNEKNNNT